MTRETKLALWSISIVAKFAFLKKQGTKMPTYLSAMQKSFNYIVWAEASGEVSTKDQVLLNLIANISNLVTTYIDGNQVAYTRGPRGELIFISYATGYARATVYVSR